MTATTTRTLVRQGIAAYFGGSFNAELRAYQSGPLTSQGLGVVRAGWGKRINFADFMQGQTAGRGMGAYMIVEVGRDKEVREAIAGAPQLTSGSITAGGVKLITYRVSLNVFHMAQKGFAEDAQADIDLLIEAIKQQIRVDRTLGGICTDAGETRYGIETQEGYPGIDKNDRTGTWFQIQFECRTQIIA